MRVHVVDPSAYTPPYDHALCSALAAQGVEVTLYTSRFAYGTVPAPDGYARRESFYRLASHARSPRLRRGLKLVEHVPDMLAYGRRSRSAQIVHFQWLALSSSTVPCCRGAARSCSPPTTSCRASRAPASAAPSGVCTGVSTP